MRKVNYKTRIETIPIKGIKVKLHHITNIEELFNEMMKKDSSSIEMKDERIPYWTELWPSAIALSEFIVEHKVVNEKTSVHEIGCGLSLPGIVCLRPRVRSQEREAFGKTLLCRQQQSMII